MADLVQEHGGLACGDFVWYPAGNQITQQRMQPADGLVAGPGQITVAFGPHLQHAGVAVSDDLLWAADRSAATATGRASLGSFLPVFPVCSSRTRAASLGCTSLPPLTGGDQLLGQQAAQPGGALHRPGPLRPGPRPGGQLAGLARACPDPQRAQRLLGRAHCHRGVRALMRGRSRSPLPSAHSPSSPGHSDRPQRTCLIPDLRWALVPLSSHATARSDRAGASI
jgi:hypothetical protein